MSTNNKISNLVASQLPYFVRSDHENFVAFMEAYYQWLEQNGNAVEVAKNLNTYYDVDTSVDQFADELYHTFLTLFPKDTLADKAILVKHIKDFYRSKGTEKSIEFLLRILFGPNEDNPEVTNIYYPKTDVLRASDGKWFVEKALKFYDSKIDGVANTDFIALQNFKGTKITGNLSGASAFVENIKTYYDGVVLVRELSLSNQNKDFASGETIFSTFEENGTTHSISANIYGGIVNSVELLKPGTGYKAGDLIPIEGIGTGAKVEITETSKGNIQSVYVDFGGAGFQNNDFVLFSTSGAGFGANANVSVVIDNNYYHPNSYNIVLSTIDLVASINIGNSTYPTLNSAQTDPANASISKSMSYFTYGNTGPIQSITILAPGQNYDLTPQVTVISNTRVRELGILGRMNVVSGGVGYKANDKIIFYNSPGGHGAGAWANVLSVNATGSILNVRFEAISGFLPGGSGYDQLYLPTAQVSSTNASAYGANIIVTSILADGANLKPISSTLGAIQKLTIISGGIGYDTPPTLNLTSLGDGTAQANATVVTGTYTYPGRFLNDDGFLSSTNYLEDRDYYQSFSYVVRTNQSIDKYRKYLKDLLHPAGMKLFGEYLKVDDTSVSQSFQSTNTVKSIFVSGTYKANYIPGSANTFVEVSTLRNVSNVTATYVEFINNSPQFSNVSLRVDPNYGGVLSTTGNIVRSVASANTSNLEFRVAGANQTQLSLVRSTNISNNSNLEVQTSISSNVIQLVKYTLVANTSNLQLRIGKGDKQTNANLVTFTSVANTSNLEIQTDAAYTNTNTVSIVKYTDVGLMSNVKVNTAAGAQITQINLVKQMVTTTAASNLTVNTGIGTTTNTVYLIRLQNNQVQTNLAVNTASQYSATNKINLLKFVPVMTMSNVVVTTPQVYDTDTISLQNVVTVGTTSNLEIQTGFGSDSSNTSRVIRFVNFTQVNQEANIIVSSALTPTIVSLPGYTSNISVNSGTTVSNTVSLVRLVLTPNTSNLYLYTDTALPYFSTTNIVRFSDAIANSNVYFTTGYSLNISNQTFLVTSSDANSNTITIYPEVGANLIANNFQVYSRSWPSVWRQNSNVYVANGYTISLGGTNYTVSNSVPGSNVFNVSPAMAANLVGNTFSVLYHNSNGNTSYLIVGTYFPINNTSNLKANTSIGATTNGVILSKSVSSSNVTIGEGYILNIGGAYTVNVVSIASGSGSMVVDPPITGNLKSLTVQVVSYTPVKPLSSSNVKIDNGYTISVGGRDYTVNSSNQANSTIFLDGEIATNTINSNVYVRYYYKKQWRQNSNVALSDKFTINVGSKNTITIYSSSPNSEIAYLYHAIPGNTNNATMLVVSQYRDIPVSQSNVYIANNHVINIAGNNYTVIGISNTSNTIRITPNITGVIVGNTVNVQYYYTQVNKSNSNVNFDYGYTLNIGGSQYKVLDSNANSSSVTIFPSLPGFYTANVLTVDPYYQNHWAANSNVALDVGYRINIASNTYTITSLSPNSNVITITPAITGNLFNSSMNVEPSYRQEWVANSNVAFDVGYTINIGSANTVKVVSFSPNSSLINVSANVLGGLSLSTLNVISYYRSLTPAVSNVPFDNGYTLNINGANTVIVTGFNSSSNTFTITPAINGNISNGKLVVTSYLKKQWLGNSNVFFDTGYTINAAAQVAVPNTSNLVVNTGSGVANAINLVYLVQTPFTSNLVINTASGAAVSYANLVRLVETTNTANITVSSNVGVANQINLSAWAQNSNVYFAVGYTINVNSKNTVVITDYQPTSNIIEVTPALPANLTNAILRVNTKSWVAANLGDSNVYASNSYLVTVNGINTTINTSSVTTGNVKFDTAINGNLVGATLTIYSRSWIAANLNQSNVFIGNNYLISVNGVNATVYSSNAANGVLFVTPALIGGIVGNTMNTISYSTEIQITSANQQSDVVTITPAIKGNVDNATIYVKSYYSKQWRQNSNVAFSNGYIISIGGSNVKYTVETSSATNNELRITPQPPNKLANSNLFVQNYYTDVTLNTSNVFIDDGYVLNINGNVVVAIRPSQTSNIVAVWPPITLTNANATIQTISYYKNEWLQNSNVYMTVGDTIGINTNAAYTVIGTGRQNSSAIVFGMGLASNTISSANINITRPIELSNGFYNVTANATNSNNYIFIAVGKSVNANGFVYAGI